MKIVLKGVFSFIPKVSVIGAIKVYSVSLFTNLKGRSTNDTCD